MITREQVADLQAGDVVELTRANWPEGTVLRGPLHADRDGALYLGGTAVRYSTGDALGFIYLADKNPYSLTVVSRAPRPLYVNHPRTYCVEGDVARNADDDSPPTVWLCTNPDEGYDWWYCPGEGFHHRDAAPPRLRLLVDGETGQVVP